MKGKAYASRKPAASRPKGDLYHVGGSTSRFDNLESLFHALDLFIKKHFPDKKLEYEHDTYDSIATLKSVVEENLDG